jgi:hypothetical protein
VSYKKTKLTAVKKIIIIIALCWLALSCSKEPAPLVQLPILSDHIEPENYVKRIDNRYFPLIPGRTFTYKNTIVENGDTTIQDVSVCVTTDIKVILGVECTVVHDIVKEKGRLAEDTFDWYAQDKQGNVWYFGEATKAFEEGNVNTEGSWEGGVDGARPGIIMHADPYAQIGKTYYQEFLKGEAEDQAQNLDTTGIAKVPFGNFTNCLRIKEFTALEPGVTEIKYYVSALGLVLTEMVEGGNEREVLTKVTH